MSVFEKISPRARMTYVAHMFKALAFQKFRPFVPMLRKVIEKDSIVIDVGAHAGQFTKLFSRLAPEGTVYAVEPASYTRSILTKVIALHRLRNVVVIPMGLSDRESSQTLYMPVKKSGSIGFGLSHLGQETRDGRATVSEDIPLTTLDRYMEEHAIPRLDFIKADIEGWELRFLTGAEKTIGRYKPAMYLEVSRNFLGRAGDTPEALWAFLQGHGYTIEHVIENGSDISFAPAPSPVEGNILCRAG